MKNRSKFLISAVAILAVSPMSVKAETIAETGVDFPKKQEKCYGIVKAGKNDCASASHSCATYSKIDASDQEWIMLPSGVCDRIVGAATILVEEKKQ